MFCVDNKTKRNITIYNKKGHKYISEYRYEDEGSCLWNHMVDGTVR